MLIGIARIRVYPLWKNPKPIYDRSIDARKKKKGSRVSKAQLIMDFLEENDDRAHKFTGN